MINYFKLTFLNSLHNELIFFEGVILSVKNTFNVIVKQRREIRAFTR